MYSMVPKIGTEECRKLVLTGSVRAELENRVWPGTGRILQVPMYGMSVRERLRRAGAVPFIDRVAADGIAAVTAPAEALNVRDYLDLRLAGSFPEPGPVFGRCGALVEYRVDQQLMSRAGPCRSRLRIATPGASPPPALSPITAMRPGSMLSSPAWPTSEVSLAAAGRPAGPPRSQNPG
jgi:hypothetical protein